MSFTLVERDGHRLLVADSAGPPIGRAQDVIELIEQVWAQRAAAIVVPAARLDPVFFQLRSGLAGEIVQKFVNYRIKFVVIGDISAHTAESDALRDFVRESNRGHAIFFLPDLDAVAAKLSAIAPTHA